MRLGLLEWDARPISSTAVPRMDSAARKIKFSVEKCDAPPSPPISPLSSTECLSESGAPKLGGTWYVYCECSQNVQQEIWMN